MSRFFRENESEGWENETTLKFQNTNNDYLHE